MITQADKILSYMKEHGEITQRDAVRLGCYRLSARIADLRRDGYAIRTEFKSVKNMDGGRSTIGVYKLGEVVLNG